MIDGGLRPLFHDKLRRGVHWQAIETGGTGQGIPDSNACIAGGIELWVEFKWTEAWAVGLTAEQSSWHQTRYMRGGRTFIAIRRQNEGGPRRGAAVDELWLAEGRLAPLLREGGLRAEGVDFLGVWPGGPARWDWDAVRNHLPGN